MASPAQSKKFQAFNAAGDRIATAVLTKDSRIFQVYPLDKKTYFDTKSDWLASHPDAMTEEPVCEVAAPKPKPTREISLSVKYIRQMKDEYPRKQLAVKVPNPEGDPADPEDFILIPITYFYKDDYFWTNYRYYEPRQHTSFKELGCSTDTPRLYHLSYSHYLPTQSLPYLPITSPDARPTAYILKIRSYQAKRRMIEFNAQVNKVKAHLESKGFFVCVLKMSYREQAAYWTAWAGNKNIHYVLEKIDKIAHKIACNAFGIPINEEEQHKVTFELPFTAFFAPVGTPPSIAHRFGCALNPNNFYKHSAEELIGQIGL